MITDQLATLWRKSIVEPNPAFIRQTHRPYRQSSATKPADPLTLPQAKYFASQFTETAARQQLDNTTNNSPEPPLIPGPTLIGFHLDFIQSSTSRGIFAIKRKGLVTCQETVLFIRFISFSAHVMTCM